jgi:diguanylate cyclase (GGDEF)-like protein
MAEALVLVLVVGLSWLPTYVAGGASHVPPLWPLIPIVVAARRYGVATVLAISLLGGVVAGPLTPGDVNTGAAQQVSDWLLRGGFFLAVALVASFMFRRLRIESAAHIEARAEAERVTALLKADVSYRKSLEDQLRSLAFHDPLTGLANRALLEEHLDAALERARRDSTALALIGLDLNRFKLVNDALGHGMGDRVLRDVAKRLLEATRAADLVARHGGDEFLIMVPDIRPGPDGVTDKAVATTAEVVDRIRQTMLLPFAIEDAVFEIEISAGVSIFPSDALDAETLHRHADAAMYDAKRSGSGFAVFHPDSTVDPLEPLAGAAALRQALEQNEMELHYQPIFRLSDMRGMGVEALIRWRKPDGELIPPGSFLPAAEQTGVIDDIGDFVLSELCRQAVRWRELGLLPNLGINVSPRQLRRIGFARRFSDEVQRHGLDPGQFVVELTETVWTLEGDRMWPALEELSSLGFSLAIDDFGAGYSSLARLLNLPVDVIKIDRAFLSPIPGDAQAAAIITAILRLAEACECDVVAEGVETDAQLDFLIDLGCSLAQGYHLGRPVPAAVLTPRLAAALADDRRGAIRRSVSEVAV